MLASLLSGSYIPFTMALALLFGLLALELGLLLVGGSLMGDGADAGMDVPDAGFDIDIGAIDLDGLDMETLDFDAAEFDLSPDVVPAAPTAAPSPLTWLGLGRMPMLIWLACLFLTFGVSGLVVQSVATGIAGAPLPALVAAIPCAAAALWFTGRFGAVFARLLPRTETQSVSSRQLGRRMGTVTQGTATRGHPAEVRVTDRYGNIHYLRAEPLSDADTIPQGTEVLVLRHRPTGGFRLIAL